MKPNILVLVFDAARSSNFSCYGHDRVTSPTVDGLAEEGVVFENAVAPAPVTFDSVTSFFSGLYPQEHQSGRVLQVNTDVELLPEFLRRMDYRTGVSTSSPSTTSEFGFGRGVDEYYDVTHQFKRGMNVRKFFSETNDLPKHVRWLRFLRRSLDRNLISHLGNGLRFKFGFPEHGDDGARAVTNGVTEFVDGDRPWFMYAHFTETHMNSVDDVPYRLPGERVYDFVECEVDESRLQTRSSEVDYDEGTRDIHERMYDAAIRYLDDRVAEIKQHLQHLGEWEDTIVVVTADHGECIGEHGLLGHGFAYEPAVKVPLVVKGHSIEPDRIHERVSTIGTYRTLASLLGNVPEHLRGTDLLSEPDSDWVLCQDFSDTWTWSSYEAGERGTSIFYRDGWKLIQREDDVEVYDLASDPTECDNRADAPEATELRTGLEEVLASLRNPQSAEVGEMSASTEERLRDLGYLD